MNSNQVSVHNSNCNAPYCAQTLGSVVSLVILVVSGYFALHYQIGSLRFIVACSGAGVGFLSFVGFSIYSAKRCSTAQNVHAVAGPVISNPPMPVVPPNPPSDPVDLHINDNDVDAGQKSPNDNVSVDSNISSSSDSDSEIEEDNPPQNQNTAQPVQIQTHVSRTEDYVSNSDVIEEQHEKEPPVSPSDMLTQNKTPVEDAPDFEEEDSPLTRATLNFEWPVNTDVYSSDTERTSPSPEPEEDHASKKEELPVVRTTVENDSKEEEDKDAQLTLRRKQKRDKEEISQLQPALNLHKSRESAEKESKQEADESARIAEKKRGTKEPLRPRAFHNTHKIRPFQNKYKKNLEKIEFEKPPISSGVIARLLKAVSDVGDYFMSGGPLQQRLYTHLLYSLFDPIITFLDMGELKGAPCISKVNQLTAKLSENRCRFKFLVDEESCNTPMQYHLHLAFMTLLKVAEEEQNYAVVRFTFFDELEKAWNTGEYQKSISDFRKLPKEEAVERYPELAFMQLLGFAVFTEPSLGHYAKESVFSIFKKGKNKFGENPDPKVPIADILHEDHASVDAAPASEKGGFFFKNVNQGKGTANKNFSPLKENNFSTKFGGKLLYSVGDKLHTTTGLRFGTPTSESNNDPKVFFLFELCLDYLMREDLKLASFQHQNPTPKKWGDESKRLEEMFKLAGRPEYQDTFIAFGLPMDGAFAKQQGKYETDKAWEAPEKFIKEYIEQMLYVEKPLIRLPKAVLETFPNYKQEIASIVHQVRDLFFKDKKTLTVEERRIFQVITYAHLVEYFTVGLRADFFHCQCKDAQDRAITLIATHYYLSLIRQGKDTDPEERKKFRALVHFPCLMIKGMSVHEHRFPLLEATIRHLSSLSDQERKDIRMSPIAVKGAPCLLKDFLVDDLPNQTLNRSPSEAHSREGYEKLFKIELGYADKHTSIIPDFVESVLPKNEEESFHQAQRVQCHKDFRRQHYLKDNKKIEIPEFRERLQALAEKDKTLQVTCQDVNKLVEDLVRFEAQIVDPVIFCALINNSLQKVPNFLSQVIDLYHDLRELNIKKAIAEWCQSEEIEEELVFSHQGNLQPITAALQQRYCFIAEGLQYITGVDLVDPKFQINVYQKDLKDLDSSNTCFNFITERNQPVVEAYQLWEIATGERKEIKLGYVITRTKIYRKEGHAQVESCLREKKPQDISSVIEEFHKTAEQIQEDFEREAKASGSL